MDDQEPGCGQPSETGTPYPKRKQMKNGINAREKANSQHGVITKMTQANGAKSTVSCIIGMQ